MNISHVGYGKNPPDDINVIIEIPTQHDPIKYEVDKDSSAVFVDRFMPTPMFYPANYGFITDTLADDGDPIDALVVTPYPVAVGSVIRSRPVGILHMSDEAGTDEKLLCVPHQKLTRIYDHVHNYTDLPQLLRDQIQHFFEHYKDLEPEKWVKIDTWGDVDTARKAIMVAIEAAKT